MTATSSSSTSGDPGPTDPGPGVSPGSGPEAELARRLDEGEVVVLPNRLPVEFVDELRHALAPLLAAHLADSRPNRGVNRHQMYLPFEPPFSDPALWADPTVLDIAARLLGPDFECTYYGSDTPFPGAEHQPAHQDGGPLFPQWEPRPPVYCLALNVSLVDVDHDNGPFEWFPGPERPDDDARPHRVTGPAGTMVLRDTRVWHRGSPNVASDPRPMLALLYTRPWYRFPLDRPAIDRAVYQQLPEPGPRLFRGADLTPHQRTSGDAPRLSRPSG